ncbi:MAG TPA: SLOG family protein [Methanospirillum sp.]|nr:SLOG family protein [Methanospirillum sp.]
MSKLIISGIRTCTRKETVFAEISKFASEIGGVDEIVAGGSTGVDLYAKMYAESKEIKYKEFTPNWQDDLNAAGMVRDARMAEYGTHLLVLTNGLSKESKNLIEEAKRCNLVIKTVGAFVGVSEPEAAHPVGFPTF